MASQDLENEIYSVLGNKDYCLILCFSNWMQPSNMSSDSQPAITPSGYLVRGFLCCFCLVSPLFFMQIQCWQKSLAGSVPDTAGHLPCHSQAFLCCSSSLTSEGKSLYTLSPRWWKHVMKVSGRWAEQSRWSASRRNWNSRSRYKHRQITLCRQQTNSLQLLGRHTWQIVT